MLVHRLSLRQFRNYEQVDTYLSPKANIFIGNNGQGKTNLIEALAIAYCGEFIRTKDHHYLLRKNQNRALISLTGSTNQSHDEIQFILDHQEKKWIYNGKKKTLPWLKAQFKTIVFLPEHLNSLKQGSHLRRDMVDKDISHSGYHAAELMQNYGRLLQRRNKLLKTFKESSVVNKELNTLLASVNKLYIDYAIKVTKERLAWLKLITEKMSAIFKNIFDENLDLTLSYQMSDQIFDVNEPPPIEELINKRFFELADAETKVGYSLFGPHRHDFMWILNGQNIQAMGSQGQQRSVILAYKLATLSFFREQQAKTPLLILDDVLSELDTIRRNRLLEYLVNQPIQLAITTTEDHATWIKLFSQVSLWHIEQGQLKKKWEK